MTFKVYMNGILKAEIPGNKTACKRWIRENVLSTHMGFWHRTDDGYEYSTTIGRYYDFEKIRKFKVRK